MDQVGLGFHLLTDFVLQMGLTGQLAQHEAAVSPAEDAEVRTSYPSSPLALPFMLGHDGRANLSQ